MKILIVHNHYQQSGGEDAVVKFEADLLRSRGHEVLLVEAFNSDFNKLSFISKIKNIFSWDWSKSSYALVRQNCLDFRPDIAHFHNTFFMMTPSVYAACKSVGVPVVQTLHNFRLLCVNALFYRENQPCEKCIKGPLFQAALYGCYRKSKILSWAIVRMIEKHRKMKTWIRQVDAYIALSHFSRLKFEQGGIPKDKIWVKPNCIVISELSLIQKEDYFVFAGRLSEEKGIKVLLEAFRGLKEVSLVIMGDGPLRKFMENFIKDYDLSNIRLTGFLKKEAYLEVLRKSKAVIVPSVCYETFGMAIIEAFACGVPVIASNHGSMAELVVHGQNGLLFTPGNPVDLTEKVTYLNNNPSLITTMGNQARKDFDEKYSAKSNYQQLISIYESVQRKTKS